MVDIAYSNERMRIGRNDVHAVTRPIPICKRFVAQALILIPTLDFYRPEVGSEKDLACASCMTSRASFVKLIGALQLMPMHRQCQGEHSSIT